MQLMAGFHRLPRSLGGNSLSLSVSREIDHGYRSSLQWAVFEEIHHSAVSPLLRHCVARDSLNSVLPFV